jgi:hypothetical protein
VTLNFNVADCVPGGGVGIGDMARLAPRPRNEHGNLLPVAAILFAENIDEVALFQLDGNQNVAGGRHGEQQVARGVASIAAPATRESKRTSAASVRAQSLSTATLGGFQYAGARVRAE